MNPTEVTNRKLLSEFLGIPSPTLNKYLTETPIVANWTTRSSDPDLHDKAWLIKHFIPKKNRNLGFRIVYEVKLANLAFILKSIYIQLLKSYTPTNEVHGFVPRRGIATNAEQHLGKKLILSCDIKDFFESITVKQVESVFENCGFPQKVSTDLAQLCTLDGRLAQGYVTSPMIANMVAIKLDNDLLAFASAIGATYTRYADDITFSINSSSPDINLIEKIIERHGFRLNPKKTRIMFRGEKQYVTGLTVFDNSLPRVPRRYKKQIRLILYYMGKYGKLSFQLKKLGYTEQDYEIDLKKRGEVDYKMIGDDKKLKGWIDFVNSIEPDRAMIYYEQYNALKD